MATTPDTRKSTPDIDYREMEKSVELSEIHHEGEDELMTLNMGPHHPATHGVLRLLTTLEGEIVRDVKPIIGYVHTGIEKTCEDKAYWKVIPVVERMDYLSYYFNAYAFCGAVETLLDLEIPPRAQYLRVIHLELNRIASHLIWLATGGLDLGAMSVFWYGWRDRDQILDLFEMSSGQRMHTRYFQVGGVMEDIPSGFEDAVRRFTSQFPTRLDQFEDLIDKNEIVLQRLRNVAAVDEQTLLALGSPGRSCAASGNPWDLRKAMPYSSYDDFAFKIPVGTTGDNYDRYRVRPGGDARVGEGSSSRRSTACPRARSSRRTARSRCRRATSWPPHGGADPPLQARHGGLPRSRRARLLPHRGPARRARAASIGPTARAKPRACHMRDPSFVNLQATAPMVKDAYIADFIATLAMLDPILGGIDR
jgi:NADH-quinone oxidoreductase subunit D